MAYDDLYGWKDFLIMFGIFILIFIAYGIFKY